MTNIIDVDDSIFDTELNLSKESKQEEVVVSSNSPAKKTDEKEDKRTVESYFRSHVIKSRTYSVLTDEDVNERFAMEFKEGRWVKMTKNRKIDIAEKFCAQPSFQSQYTSNKAMSCASLLTSALCNSDKKLREVDTGKHYVATLNDLVEIKDDGAYVVVNEYERFNTYVNLYCPLFLKNVQGTKIAIRDSRYIEENTKFGSLITELFPDLKTRELFQDFFGSFLTNVKSQTVPVLQGAAGRGKSVVIKVICGMLDRSRVINFSKTNSFHLAQLHLAPVIAADEMRGKVDTTLIKQVTGHSPILAEHKGETPFNFKVNGKLIFAWNNAPNFSEHSEAIEQRLVIFTVGGEAKRGNDKEIPDLDGLILREELQEVFEWALAGAIRVVKRGRLPSREEFTDRMLADKATLAKDSNPMLSMIEELGIRPGDRDGTVYAKDDVYKLVKDWFEKEGRQSGFAMSSSNVMKNLKSVLEQKYGFGCLGNELKVSVRTLDKVKRVQSIPLVFDAPVSIKPLDRGSVSTSSLDPSSYDVVPKWLQEKLEEDKRDQELISKMTEDDATKYIQEKKKEEAKKVGITLAFDNQTDYIF